ncbi:Ubiquinone biosynthesis O-methyltransferase [Pseudolycoriella hygida]|uniref:Ubiquinone biosynthesis O-methyltransferase n=1 Tax=Pseudolycoriella hygida TaxID=35572 RepID=A0A9Q0S292_9DIPT|nr:Ubiquinone biosynthesis O-methyltransferase [Pseudolycoriella hygida]
MGLNLEEGSNAPRESTDPSHTQFDKLTTIYEDMSTWPYRRDVEIPNTLGVIGNVSGLSIMDFGCGTGIYTRRLKKDGAARVVGFDPCHPMIEYAREKAIQSGLEIEYTSELVLDMYNGQFDLVLAVYVIPYAKTKSELWDMCSRMASLLKPSGRLITLQIHPDYNLHPDYYKEYGIRLMKNESDDSDNYKDGGVVQLHICYKELDIKVNSTYWSRATLTEALFDAGFSSVVQTDLSKFSLEDISPTLLKYINQPHASLVECVK